MNKKEFKQWVKKTYRDFQKDKQAIAYSGCSGVVIVYDTTAVKSAIAKCCPQDTFDYDTGVAIAYARLKEIEIPKVEEEPEFKRVGNEQEYYYIGKFNTARFGAVCTQEIGHFLDKAFFENNNYFHTKKRAEEVADKINFLLKLERFHDIYCPNYKPDWSNDKDYKHYIYYSEKAKKWTFDVITKYHLVVCVYFPTSEIAQKVCDILNKERGNNER